MNPPLQDALSRRHIFNFWLPLMATWVLMSLEGPLLTAFIARMGEAKENLAAYGVGFIIGLIMESPVIMLMSAATALVRCRRSYAALWRFTLILCALSTLASVVLVIPPVFDAITLGLLELPKSVAEKVWLASVFLIPWPAAIGIRRFLQGVLIAAGQTRPVAIGTAIRLVALALGAGLLFFEGRLGGAALGGAALSIGVLAEALFIGWASKNPRTSLPLESALTTTNSLSLSSLSRFYWPLFTTTAIGLLIQPIITFFAGRGPDALESLAVLPVMNSTAFLFRAIGLSYQEVILALHQRSEHRLESLRRFAQGIAWGNSLIFSLLILTPAADWWFGRVTGLSPELISFLKWPLLCLFALPALSVGISWGRSLAVLTGRTKQVSVSAAAELASVTLIMFVCTLTGSINGALAGALATVGGRLVAAFSLPRSKPFSSQDDSRRFGGSQTKDHG